MQFRVRTLLLFTAVCATTCALVEQFSVFWLKAFASAVPLMWGGLAIMLVGRALYHRRLHVTGLDAYLDRFAGSVLVGIATLIIPFATALVALGMIALLD